MGPSLARLSSVAYFHGRHVVAWVADVVRVVVFHVFGAVVGVAGQIDELQGKVASAIEAVNDSSDQWRTQINQRLSEIEDATRAFNQYRPQVNNRLDSLEQ